MNIQLTNSFLDELFKSLFIKKSMIEVINKYFEYQFIPKEYNSYKKILQSILNQWDLTQKLPSYGIISQQYQSDVDVQSTLSRIKKSDVIDNESLLNQFGEYIKDVKFQLAFEQTYEAYERGDKEGALKIYTEGAEEIANFSLKKEGMQFMKVFGDFKKIQHEKDLRRETGEDLKEKVPFGIDMIDNLTDGGFDKGDTALWVLRSGMGKSTALKHTGMYACRLGYNVLHFQLEGGKEEAHDKYTQVWTACSYPEIKWGNIPENKVKKIDKALEDMLHKQRDIDLYSFESFGSASMVEIREIVIEYHKIHNKFPDIIIIDSLDLCITGENKKIDFDPNFKKDRLKRCAQLAKDIAVEFDTRVLEATQTGSIAKEKWNNPDFVITDEHTEGDRTLVQPFSYVFSGNQTNDEKKKGLMRINLIKLRNYSLKDQVYPIFTNYNIGRFYNRPKTLREFSEMYEDEN